MSNPIMRMAELDYLDRQNPEMPVERLGDMAEGFRNGSAAALAAERTRRRVVQIATGCGDMRAYVVALCNDGAILTRSFFGPGDWAEFPRIPQPEAGGQKDG